MTFKVHLVLNSALPFEEKTTIYMLWIVENKYGKFLLNWTEASRQNIVENELPEFATIKQMQLGHVQGSWLNDDPFVIVQEVVPGPSGTIEEKIRQICEGTANGQRVLVCVHKNEYERYFYKALNINPDNPNIKSVCKLEDFDLSMKAPFLAIESNNMDFLKQAEIL